MKILHIAYSLEESSAAVRLAEMFDSNMNCEQYFLLGRVSKYDFVRKRQIAIFVANIIGIFSHIQNILWSYLLLENRRDIFSFGNHSWIKKKIFEVLIKERKFDLIFIHWIGYNFFPLDSLNKLANTKIIAILHDYYLLTGGCHVPMSCPQFVNSCENCPVSSNILGRYMIQKHKKDKLNSLKKNSVKIISLSSYSESIVKNIYGNDVIFIPNTISNIYFKNVNQLNNIYDNYLVSRKLNLNIPTIVVIGIKESKRNNKGLDLLLKSLEIFHKFNNKVNFVTQGDYVDISKYGSQIHFSFLTSNEIKSIYENADITLVCSRYETFSQVTLESILSLTPVIAYKLTGPKDIIVDGVTGFLVQPFNAEEFAIILNLNLNYKKSNKEKLLLNTQKTLIRYSSKSIYESFEKAIKFTKYE